MIANAMFLFDLHVYISLCQAVLSMQPWLTPFI